MKRKHVAIEDNLESKPQNTTSKKAQEMQPKPNPLYYNKRGRNRNTDKISIPFS